LLSDSDDLDESVVLAPRNSSFNVDQASSQRPVEIDCGTMLRGQPGNDKSSSVSSYHFYRAAVLNPLTITMSL